MPPVVTSVSSRSDHAVSKIVRKSITLITGHGVDGDAHFGTKVKHRSRVARDPSQPNLRQVHLLHSERHDELRELGFDIAPGEMGENITTRGIDLLALPTGTRLHIGADAIIEVTGLRNPCKQLEGLHEGLMAANLARDSAGGLIRKAGIMGIVVHDGAVRAGDTIEVELPSAPHRSLEPV